MLENISNDGLDDKDQGSYKNTLKWTNSGSSFQTCLHDYDTHSISIFHPGDCGHWDACCCTAQGHKGAKGGIVRFRSPQDSGKNC